MCPLFAGRITIKRLIHRTCQAGLNKGEVRNALASAVFVHRQGEIRVIAPVGY
ncbi:transposase [Salmonella enterica]|nr:Tn3 family transposase [Salmonella enterica]EFQ6619434.1 transposase [Salmonella enterica]